MKKEKRKTMRPKNTHINWNTNFVLPLILLSIFASLLLYNPTAEGRTKMYWTGARSIDRAQTDGANLETLLPVTLSRPRYLAIDTSGGKIYWTDPGTGRIQRSNLDGTGVEDLVTTGLNLPREGFFKTARFGVEDTLTLFSRQTPPIGGKSAEKSCDSVAFATADTCGLNPPSRWFPSQSPTAQRGSDPVVCHGQKVDFSEKMRYVVLSQKRIPFSKKESSS